MTLSCMLLTACGGASEPGERPEPPPVADTVFGDAVGTMDRARAVEDTAMQHKQAIDSELDQVETSAE